MRRLALVAAALAVACSSKNDGDTTPPGVPVIATPSDGATILAADLVAGQVVFSGTAEAGATVEVQVDGTAGGSGVASAAGAWSVAASVANGGHTVRARAIDGAGNASAFCAAVSFTVSGAVPAVPVILVPGEGAALALRDLVAGLVVVSGTAPAGATVELQLDGVPAGTATAAADGAWAVAADVPDGGHAARARARDAAGNWSALCAAVSFSLDATAPAEPAVVAPQANALLGAADLVAGEVLVSGTAEPSITVEVQVDGALAATTIASAGGTWSAGVALADGVHAVRARALDAVANPSTLSPAVSFTVDTTAPAAPAIASPGSGTLLGASSLVAGKVVVSGSAEAGATVAVEADGTAAGTVAADAGGSWTLALTLPDGQHSLRARATDAARNVSLPSQTVAITLDTVAPAAPIVLSPPNGAALVSTDLVNGQVVFAGAAEPGAAIALRLEGGVAGSGVADAAGDWSIAVTVASGTHRVVATATDAAQNPSPPSTEVRFTLDAIRLALPIPAGSPLPVTAWGQTVPVSGGDASGLGEAFPGQANTWVLAPDFSLSAGFGLEYGNALVLYTGTPTGPMSHATLENDLLARVYDQFPGDQTAAETTYLTPLFGVPDGLVTAVASDGATMGVPLLNNTTKAFLNGTSDSRLSQILMLDPAQTYTFAWTHEAFLVSGSLAGAAPAEYQVVLRDPSSDAVLATLFSSSTNVLPATESVSLGGLPAQVVLSFELRSAAPGYAEIDDVAVTGGSVPVALSNGHFEAGLAGWVANDGAQSQNVRSGARDVGSTGSPLRITRTFYAPPGATWGRLVDLFENTTATTIQTHAIYLTILGGASPLAAPTPDGTAVVGWDATAIPPNTPPKSRDVGIVNGLPVFAALGVPYVAAGDPFVFVDHLLVVPAGSRIALAHYVVQLGEAAGGTTSAGVPAATAAACGAIVAGYGTVDTYRLDFEPGVEALVQNF